MTLNKARLGSKFFEEGIGEAQISLGIHELAHHFCDNHLSDDFHEACCRLGAKLALAVTAGKLKIE